MVPSGSLDLVRRISLYDGSSRVSSRMSREDIKDLVIFKRGLEPDDRLFLYANAVVFVEGRNDAEALREWVMRRDPELLQKAGIEIRACEGKTQVAALFV